MASMYAVYHGPEGLRNIAQRIYKYASVFADGMKDMGFNVINDSYFDTLSIEVKNSDAVVMQAEKNGYNVNVFSKTLVSVSFDELSTPEDIEYLWRIFNTESELSAQLFFEKNKSKIKKSLKRESDFLTHEVFNTYRSETNMMRYIRYLGDKDIALDRSMIPLGSCTMKLNAAAELIPVSWPEFSQIHPAVPMNQVIGYQQMISELEEMLCEATGYSAISLQPNSGAQGEYAGLIAI